MNNIKIKLTNENAQLPTRANPTDAGADLHSPSCINIIPKHDRFIDLGIQLEIPDGYCGLIFARSGIGSRQGIRPKNCVGVIDSKYRGNIGVMVENAGELPFLINVGDRIAQLVIVPVVTPQFILSDTLDEVNDRGGGFGHTGK